MQMARLYGGVNRSRRAAEMRRDAAECHKAGFATIAECLYQEAECLSPTPVNRDRDEDSQSRGRRNGVDSGVRTATVPGGGKEVPTNRPIGLTARNDSSPPIRLGGTVTSGRGPHPRNRRDGVAEAR
jgi:hypothetical protein